MTHASVAALASLAIAFFLVSTSSRATPIAAESAASSALLADSASAYSCEPLIEDFLNPAVLDLAGLEAHPERTFSIDAVFARRVSTFDDEFMDSPQVTALSVNEQAICMQQA